MNGEASAWADVADTFFLERAFFGLFANDRQPSTNDPCLHSATIPYHFTIPVLHHEDLPVAVIVHLAMVGHGLCGPHTESVDVIAIIVLSLGGFGGFRRQDDDDHRLFSNLAGSDSASNLSLWTRHAYFNVCCFFYPT